MEGLLWPKSGPLWNGESSRIRQLKLKVTDNGDPPSTRSSGIASTSTVLDFVPESELVLTSYSTHVVTQGRPTLAGAEALLRVARMASSALSPCFPPIFLFSRSCILTLALMCLLLKSTLSRVTVSNRSACTFNRFVGDGRSR